MLQTLSRKISVLKECSNSIEERTNKVKYSIAQGQPEKALEHLVNLGRWNTLLQTTIDEIKEG